MDEMLKLIRVVSNKDGSYAVYRDGEMLITGLTRIEANRFSRLVKARRDYR